MLAQCHLSPFVAPVQPTLWDLDGSLRLYPPPDALVITEPGPVCSISVDGVQCALSAWVVLPGLLLCWLLSPFCRALFAPLPLLPSEVRWGVLASPV